MKPRVIEIALILFSWHLVEWSISLLLVLLLLHRLTHHDGCLTKLCRGCVELLDLLVDVSVRVLVLTLRLVLLEQEVLVVPFHSLFARVFLHVSVRLILLKPGRSLVG